MKGITLHRIPLLAVLIAVFTAMGPGHAQQQQYYDLDALGVPKFVNTNYIDLPKVTRLSKFRSSAGHDYHDDVERCRSMKHYFIAPDASAVIRAPVAGTVTRLRADNDGTQTHITSDLYPAFIFIIFHVNLASPLAIGDHVAEGQVLGTHIGQQTFSDIAVGVNATNGYRLVSYFETLTEAAFAPFQARGIQSVSQLIFPKAVRDAAPYQCSGEAFINLPVPADTEYVPLTGGASTQSITVTNAFEAVLVSRPPLALNATASSGLPVAIASTTPSICTVAGSTVSFLAAGVCTLRFTQSGNADYFAATPLQYSITVLPIPAPTGPIFYAGPIFSSAQTASQSYVRFYNTGADDGTITIVLRDYTSGQQLGQWTSPSITAGSAQQYPITTIETALTPGTAKPNYYSLSVQTSLVGLFQHVLWRSADGTLTNLSTCDTGVTANSTRLNNVHSSLLDFGYPSSVVIHNTGNISAPILLGIYNAATGVKLGEYTTPTIFGGGQVVIPVATIETAVGISPGTSIYHYIIKIESTLNGFLQHLVTNKQAGVVTDMTAACAVNTTPTTTTASPLRSGVVYSTAQNSAQSYLRFYNTGSTAGTITVTLSNDATGLPIGQWTSPSIPPESAQQYAIATIENGLGVSFTKPTTYAVTVQSTLSGAFQNVLWRTTDGTLTNLSTCNGGVTALGDKLNNVHSSLLDTGYPSSIVVNNTGATAAALTLGLYHATTGVRLGGTTTAAVPSHGQLILPIASLEATSNVSPGTAIYHYVVKIDSVFAGFLQHLMTNTQSGVVTDMTTVCRMN